MESKTSLMASLEAVASNCSLRVEHIEALNTSDELLLQRLYNMCEHTWDPAKTWHVFYWDQLIPPLIVYSLTLLLGIVGNVVIVGTIGCGRNMHTPTNVFLASLAVADLVLCVVCIPVKLAEIFSFSWTLGEFLCKFVNYCQSVSAVASVLNLTVMSLERCYAIVHPMRARSESTVSQALRVVSLVWMLSLILAAPSLIVQTHLEVGLVEKAFWCVRNPDVPHMWQLLEVYYLIVILVIPGSLMAVAHLAIGKEICKCIEDRAYFNAALDNSRGSHYSRQMSCSSMMTSGRNSHPHPPRLRPERPRSRRITLDFELETNTEPATTSDLVLAVDKSKSRHRELSDQAGQMDVVELRPLVKREEKLSMVTQSDVESLSRFRSVIRMLVVIIVVFAVCWTPYLVINVLQAFGIVDAQLRGFTKHLRTIFILMAYLNSALNPIIYGFMSRSFRESFTQSFVNGNCEPGFRVESNNGNSGNVGEMGSGLRVNRSRGRLRSNAERAFKRQWSGFIT